MLFLLTASDKILHFQKHIEGIKNYNLLNKKFIVPFLLATIITEFYISLTFLFYKVSLFNASLVISIIIIYSLGVIINLIRGNNNIPCSCGTILENDQLNSGIIIRNIVLIGIVIYVYFFREQHLNALTFWEFITAYIYSILTLMLLVLLKQINRIKSMLYKLSN